MGVKGVPKVVEEEGAVFVLGYCAQIDCAQIDCARGQALVDGEPMKLGARKRRARGGAEDDEDPFGGEDSGGEAPAEAASAKDARKAVNARLQAVNEINARTASRSGGGGGEELDAALEAARRSADAAQKEEKKSRYIDSLLKTAKQREMQHERAREKLIRKNIEDESAELGAPTEVFVTGAYKEKLQERKRWEEEEAKRDEEAEKNQTRDLGAFSRSFLMGPQDAAQKPSSAPGEASARLPMSPLTTITAGGQSKASSRARDPDRKPAEPSTAAAEKEIASRSAPPPRRCTITPEELEAARQRALERKRLRLEKAAT